MMDIPFGDYAAVYDPDCPYRVVLEHGHEFGRAGVSADRQSAILSRACLPTTCPCPRLRAAVTYSSKCGEGIPRTSETSPILEHGDRALHLVNSIYASFLSTSGNKIASPNRDVVYARRSPI